MSEPASPSPEPLSLSDGARGAIETVLELLEHDPGAPSSVRSRKEARKVHVADSLSGLGFGQLRTATRVCDLGAGAGFPGLVLAAALPTVHFELLDSVSKKCEFMRRAVGVAGLENVEVIDDRAESWALGAGRERYELVLARAVGRLSTLAELAVPLLAEGGSLLAWKGKRDPDEEEELERAAAGLAMRPAEVRWVGPYAGSENRHLHLISKTGPTPAKLPRRPGMAKKRPAGSA